MSYTTELRQWADSHETSVEIAQAIHDIAGEFQSVEHVWQDPSDDERDVIIAKAWKLADSDETELHWGDNTIIHPAIVLLKQYAGNSLPAIIGQDNGGTLINRECVMVNVDDEIEAIAEHGYVLSIQAVDKTTAVDVSVEAGENSDCAIEHPEHYDDWVCISYDAGGFCAEIYAPKAGY